jgi:hypothetical protein
MARESKIRELMKAAHEGMLPLAGEASAAEVFSAYLTMAGHSIEAAKTMGVPAEALREAILGMLVPCDDSNLKVM